MQHTVEASLLRPLYLPVRLWLGVSLPALLLLLAGAVTVYATGNNPPFQGLDNSVNAFLITTRTPWLTNVNMVLNFVGNAGMVIYCVALVAVLAIKHRRLALFVAGANLGALALTHLIKFLVGRPRPLDRLVQVDSGSFPSGHVSATAAAMVSTAVVLGKLWMWISGAILTVAMMYSRMYLGAHWLSDTIAGALLGVGLTILLWGLVQDKCLQRNVSAER